MVSIYTLADPRTNEVKYVGKTIYSLKDRLYGHLRIRKITSRRQNWIISLKNKGLSPVIELIDIVSDDVWEEEEIFYISYFRFLGFVLFNVTEGGDGTKGFKWSEECRRKFIKQRTGVPRKEETKRRIRETLKGRKRPKEVGQKISIGLRGKKQTPKQLERLRIGRESLRKRVAQYDTNWNFIREYSSLSEAAKDVGVIGTSHMTKAITLKNRDGSDRVCGGFKWRFI